MGFVAVSQRGKNRPRFLSVFLPFFKRPKDMFESADENSINTSENVAEQPAEPSGATLEESSENSHLEDK